MENSEKIIKVQGVFKHYDWGGKTFLPQLLHRSNEELKPYAEYWMGSDLHEAAGKLPYLFKVQDVKKMLSIQVHPTREVAKKKFEEENRRGIAVNAPNRNYKDENHKPELLSPLGDFYLLHGFRPAELLKDILQKTPELNFLLKEFEPSNYKRLYTAVMSMPQEDVNRILAPLLKRIVPAYHDRQLSKEEPDFWAARAAITFNVDDNIDRGIFSIYLFNIVHMKEGEALFQDAGLPHAYLEGQTMEIMANSDNVLRGGLTPKHVDVPELLANVVFEPTEPKVIRGTSGETHEEVFITPATDFQLSRIIIEPHKGIALAALKPDIYFVYQGTGEAVADELEVPFRSGDSLLVLPGTAVHFRTDERAVLYRASVPVSAE
jgi:mannose-6-phosphate isomerase